ncbi:MAG: hypothetical protein NXI32_30030 [bacterium]|nr:hypothetical protein [bacterium]
MSQSVEESDAGADFTTVVYVYPGNEPVEAAMALPDFVSAAAAHTMEQSAVRFNDQSAALGAIERMEFQKDLKWTNAAVQQTVEQDGLANLLVQLKSSGNYPPNTNVQPS